MVNGTEIIYEGNPVSKALNKPIDKETLLKQMKKTGNSDFDFTNIEIICDEDGFLPIGAINQARRDFLEKVRQYLISQYTRKSVEDSRVLACICISGKLSLINLKTPISCTITASKPFS